MTVHEEVVILRETVAEKDSAITSLTEEIQKLKEQNEWLKRQMFGAKKERFVDNSDVPLLPGMEPGEPEEAQKTTLKVESHERKAHRNQTG